MREIVREDQWALYLLESGEIEISHWHLSQEEIHEKWTGNRQETCPFCSKSPPRSLVNTFMLMEFRKPITRYSLSGNRGTTVVFS